MSLKCKLGLHSWDGCKCTECAKIRNKQHVWDGCKCTKCRKKRNEQHDWSKDCEKCEKCAETRKNQHAWNGCKCSKCGLIRDDNHTLNGIFCDTCNKLMDFAIRRDIVSWFYDKGCGRKFGECCSKGNTHMRDISFSKIRQLDIWCENECLLTEAMIIVIAMRIQGIIKENSVKINAEVINKAIADIIDTNNGLDEIDGIIVLNKDVSRSKFNEIVRNIFIKLNKVNFPDFIDQKNFKIVSDNSRLALRMLYEKSLDIDVIYKLRYQLYGYYVFTNSSKPIVSQFCGVHYWDSNPSLYE